MDFSNLYLVNFWLPESNSSSWIPESKFSSALAFGATGDDAFVKVSSKCRDEDPELVDIITLEHAVTMKSLLNSRGPSKKTLDPRKAFIVVWHSDELEDSRPQTVLVEANGHVMAGVVASKAVHQEHITLDRNSLRFDKIQSLASLFEDSDIELTIDELIPAWLNLDPEVTQRIKEITS